MTINRENDLAIRQDSPLYHVRQFFDALQRTTDEYLFVVDLSSGLTLLSNNFVEEFNLQSNIITDIDSLLMENIYPDDQERYAQSIHDVLIEKVSDTYELELRLLNQDGDYGWAECRGFISHDKDGNEIMRTGVVSRLDKRRHADDVTGLLNRFSLSRSLRQELSSPDSHGAVVSVGLDNFHVISETYGYHFADIAMKQIAQNISNVLPPDVNLYKLDGDQFALMLPDAMPEEIEIIFASIQLCMREIRNVEDTIYCTASAGAAFYPSDADDEITILKYAEAAMEIARQQGRDRIVFFSQETYDRWRYDTSMQSLMQNCIARGCEDFFLCFQPQVDAKNGHLIGAEALLRWRDKDGSIIAPMQFIPMLEKSRMIIPVGHWIVEQAFAVCKEWQEYMPDFQMSINISLYQLEEHMFYPFVKDCLDRYGLRPETITFELTESQSVSDWEFVNRQFNQFHQLGIKIAMDDFGTGYSSLGFLKNFSCNLIKIDRLFVQDILTGAFDQNLVKYTVMLCHSIGMEVCIEGVEEEEAYIFLRDECKADIIQGFYFGRPERKQVFLRRLKSLKRKTG